MRKSTKWGLFSPHSNRWLSYRHEYFKNEMHFLLQEYSVTFSSYFNVLWQEPRLHISERFLQELNSTSPDTMIPVNLELVNELWLPNIFIYNLKTFKVVEVLSKHAGLWITTNNDVFYSQATHITFICPMRFDAFPLDTQVRWFASCNSSLLLTLINNRWRWDYRKSQ